jgi:hypothetical protein
VTLLLRLVLFFTNPKDDHEEASKAHFKRGTPELFQKPDLAEKIRKIRSGPGHNQRHDLHADYPRVESNGSNPQKAALPGAAFPL